jgi:hypothetical protein
MKVVVTGSREAGLEWVCGPRTVEDLLSAEFSALPATSLAHGGARGLDLSAAGVFAIYGDGRDVRCFPAEWDRYGKAAGHRRNALMLDTFKPDIVLAFPRAAGAFFRRGTTGCIEAAIERGIVVHVYPVSPPEAQP